MAKLCDYNKHNNRILSVTFQMTTPAEIMVYKKLLASEGTLKCPECTEPLTNMPEPSGVGEQTESGMFIMVLNPTSENGLGFATGNPYIICPKCGARVALSMVDIEPFAEVAMFITQLKQGEERMEKTRGTKTRKE